MLTETKNPSLSFPRRQNGAVLVIALIVLVAMTLAGLALMRSVDTSNIIAGNLAFRHSATHASDKGIEAAITCLTTANTGTTLDSDYSTCGYLAARADPSAGQSWGDYWTSLLDGQSVSLGTDANGNTIKYVIHRMCASSGPSTAASSGCAFAPTACDQTSSTTNSSNCFTGAAQVYYRVTSQVSGPRNTTTYIQAMIAL